jgi:hypothetical protein
MAESNEPDKCEFISEWPPPDLEHDEDKTLEEVIPQSREELRLSALQSKIEGMYSSRVSRRKRVDADVSEHKRIRLNDESGSESQPANAKHFLALWLRRGGFLGQVPASSLNPRTKLNVVAKTRPAQLALREELLRLLSADSPETARLCFCVASFFEQLEDVAKAEQEMRRCCELHDVNVDGLEAMTHADYLRAVEDMGEEQREALWTLCKIKLATTMREKALNRSSKRDLKSGMY